MRIESWSPQAFSLAPFFSLLRSSPGKRAYRASLVPVLHLPGKPPQNHSPSTERGKKLSGWNVADARALHRFFALIAILEHATSLKRALRCARAADVPAILGPTPAHVRLSLSDRNPFRRDQRLWAAPLCAKTLKSRNPPFPQNLVKRVPHARARVRKIRFFDHPYTPRKREQSRTSGGKAVKLGLANMLQVGFTGLLALAPIRGQWTDAGRSALGLAMDWQAWGTKGGLCWRATRDGLRHVPAGPPKSRQVENSSTPAPRDLRKQRYSARRATISIEHVSQSIQAKTARETALVNRNSILRRAPSAGAGKNALFPRGVSPREGLLGLPLGLVWGFGFAQLIPTHQVTRGNQSRKPDTGKECGKFESHV